jgi:hypothetical protein
MAKSIRCWLRPFQNWNISLKIRILALTVEVNPRHINCRLKNFAK